MRGKPLPVYITPFPEYHYCEIAYDWDHPQFMQHSAEFVRARTWLIEQGVNMLHQDFTRNGGRDLDRYFLKFTSSQDMLAFQLIFANLVVR